MLLVFSTPSVGTLCVYSCWGRFLRVRLLDQDGLSFGHPCWNVCFCQASIHLDIQSVVDGSNFFKLESTYAIMAWSLPVWYFLECFSEWIDVHFRLRSLFESSLCYLSIRLFYYDLSVLILFSKIVLLSLYPVVGLSSRIHPLLAGKIFCCCLEMSCFFCIVDPDSISF